MVGEGIKKVHLVTYKNQYIHEEIALIIPKGTPMNLLILRKHKKSDFQKTSFRRRKATKNRAFSFLPISEPGLNKIKDENFQ